MESLIITRQDLYKKIWSKPIIKIAAEYGISDSMVIKICKKLGVPRPGPGHWTKVAVGKKVRQLPLGRLPKGCQEQYCISVYQQKRRLLTSDQDHPLTHREVQDDFKIVVSNSLEGAHPLVVRNGKSFNNATVSEKLILQPRAKTHFDLRVTESTKDRALAIMNALLFAFEKRGWVFDISSDSESTMNVTVLEEPIRFCVEEKIRHVEHVATEKEKRAKAAGKWVWPPRYDPVATGLLSIQILTGYGLVARHTWSDGKVQRVEGCLNKFCVALVELAEAIKVDRVRREEDERQRELARVRRQELKDAREAEIVKREALEVDVARWEKANRLRQFINEFEVSIRGGSVPAEDLVSKEQWIAWARNYADLVDPLSEGVETAVENTEERHSTSWWAK